MTMSVAIPRSLPTVSVKKAAMAALALVVAFSMALNVYYYAAASAINGDLVEAGFDSLSLAKLLLYIEEKYGFWIPEGEITPEALKNVNTLSELVLRISDSAQTSG